MSSLAKKSVILIIISVVCVTIVIILKFADYFNNNTGAVQAAFTLALVAATIYYAWQTRRTVEEISNQTEIAQMPVLVLYIRDVRDNMENKADSNEQQRAKRRFGKHLIKTTSEGDGSNYYLAVRNVGNGPASNLEVSGEGLEVGSYQSRFVAPTKDEQRFLVSKVGGAFSALEELNDKDIDIRCEDMKGNMYTFKYKIVDLEQKEIKFIEKIH